MPIETVFTIQQIRALIEALSSRALASEMLDLVGDSNAQRNKGRLLC
jgi:hypothetical protein